MFYQFFKKFLTSNRLQYHSNRLQDQRIQVIDYSSRVIDYMFRNFSFSQTDPLCNRLPPGCNRLHPRKFAKMTVFLHKISFQNHFIHSQITCNRLPLILSQPPTFKSSFLPLLLKSFTSNP